MNRPERKTIRARKFSPAQVTDLRLLPRDPGAAVSRGVERFAEQPVFWPISGGRISRKARTFRLRDVEVCRSKDLRYTLTKNRIACPNPQENGPLEKTRRSGTLFSVSG